MNKSHPSVFGIDAHGNVNEWNFKTAEITGYSREEAFDKPLVKTFIAPRFRESVQEVLDKALTGIETANYELEFDTKSNETRFLLVNASTRRDIENNIVGGEYCTVLYCTRYSISRALCLCILMIMVSYYCYHFTHHNP